MRLLLGAAIAAALVAGCGSRTPGASAHINATTTAKSTSKSTTKPSALAFAKCMRAHGVPDFPDPRGSGLIPTTSSRGIALAPSGGFTANPDSPAYETASNDCRSLAVATPVSQTQSNQITAAQLKFAICMRAHGVPNYPDPTNTGEIGNNGAISGVNPNSPAFQIAEKTCSRSLTPSPGAPRGGPSPPSRGGR
jgi:hypothetical protein